MAQRLDDKKFQDFIAKALRETMIDLSDCNSSKENLNFNNLEDPKNNS